MIKFSSQYCFVFSMGPKQDFITTKDLVSFTIDELTGNVLPMFEITFYTEDSELIRFINEGNTINVSFGDVQNEMLTAELFIMKPEITRLGMQRFLIHAKGMYHVPQFLTDAKMKAYKNKSSLEVIKEIASIYFKKQKIEISATSDKQTWLQHNITDRKFLNELWMHSYIPGGSFMLTGISSDGTFIVKDMVSLKKEQPKWSFVSGVAPASDKDIKVEGDYEVMSGNTFINHYIGYGRQRRMRSLEKGETTISTPGEDAKPMLALTKDFVRYEEIGTRVGKANIQTSNVHSKYWEARHSNLMKLALFGSVKVRMSYSNDFHPLKVLDLAMYRDEATECNMLNQSAESHSGLYIITRITRKLMNNSFSTVVVLCRDSINKIRGELE